MSSDQTYSYINSHQTIYRVLTADGTVIKGGTIGHLSRPSSTNLRGDKINAVITSGRMDASFTYDFDKDGNCPQLDPVKE